MVSRSPFKDWTSNPRLVDGYKWVVLWFSLFFPFSLFFLSTLSFSSFPFLPFPFSLLFLLSLSLSLSHTLSQHSQTPDTHHTTHTLTDKAILSNCKHTHFSLFSTPFFQCLPRTHLPTCPPTCLRACLNTFLFDPFPNKHKHTRTITPLEKGSQLYPSYYLTHSTLTQHSFARFLPASQFTFTSSSSFFLANKQRTPAKAARCLLNQRTNNNNKKTLFSERED